MPFGSLAPTYTPKSTQRLLAEFWIQLNWPPYLPDLNLLDFYIWSVFQAKDQAMPRANLAALRPSITMELDWLAVVYIDKTCHSFCRCRLEAVVAKNGAFIEYMVSQQSSTHQPVLFRPNISFNKT
jgi:hypothetical protein